MKAAMLEYASMTYTRYSEAFMTSARVPRGCILASVLFCQAMELIINRKVTNHHRIQLPEHSFSDFYYANDVALLDSSTTNLVKTLNHLEMEASHPGLRISWVMTKLQNLSSAAPYTA